MGNPAQELIKFGQSVWYDNISRDLLDNGELARMVREWGVRGLTSNPSIFDKAIGSSSLYDASVKAGKLAGLSSDQIFENLAVEDISRAADLLLPVFKESKGDDGFVSIEVSPLLASDTQGTITEARRLYAKVNKPNVMIKVPGTKEGLPAVRTLLEEGISVNITLLFSVANYEAVAQTYVEALQARAAKGKPIDAVRSVASFFVSRVDSAVDKKLDELIKQGGARAAKAQELRGKLGVANSKAAYQSFLKIFSSDTFLALAAKGAAKQRPLWASTSTKDPSFPDLLYVEELIGADTVNTLPHNTLEALVDHGRPRPSIEEDIKAALAVEKGLIAVGIDVPKILEFLQTDGVEKFVDSFRALNKTIENKFA